MRRLSLVAVAALALAVTAAASAARVPSPAERQGITNALPSFIRAIPAGCVWLDERVSADANYASVGLLFLNTVPPHTQCLRYASNGAFILQKTRGKWRVIYNGSDPPRCSLHIPADLARCRG